MNNSQPNNNTPNFDKFQNASKVIEYLRFEMALMKQEQIEYQKEYEHEGTGILIPFSGIMGFYMSEKKRILSLEDEEQRKNEQEQLDKRLTKNIKRFHPTSAIMLEDGDVNKLMDLVQEGLVKMDVDTESTAPELNYSSTFRRITKSSLRTAPEFMLRILESLRGKISEVEEPEKVCELEKYISYLRLMVRAEMNLTVGSPIQYYYGTPVKNEEELANNVCYIRERVKFCYSMNRDGKTKESRWIDWNKQRINSGMNRENSTIPDIALRDELSRIETPENLRLAVLFHELARLKGYNDSVEYRRAEEGIAEQRGIEISDDFEIPDRQTRILEIQAKINDLLKGTAR